MVDAPTQLDFGMKLEKNVPNSFNDFHLMYVYIIWGELGLCAEIFWVNTK